MTFVVGEPYSKISPEDLRMGVQWCSRVVVHYAKDHADWWLVVQASSIGVKLLVGNVESACTRVIRTIERMNGTCGQKLCEHRHLPSQQAIDFQIASLTVFVRSGC
jgi:hypothetical protein